MAWLKRPTKDKDPLAKDRTADFAKMKFRRVRFTFEPKDATMTIRMPKSLVKEAKRVAKKQGVKYQAMIREAIVQYVEKAA